MLSRLKFNLSQLANEMLDQLPEQVFISDSTTFYDPAMGGGQFLIEVVNRLKKYNHSDDNISKRIFGSEENKLRVNYVKNLHKLPGEFKIKLIEDMKFDIVLGNPPYQAQGGKPGVNHLWPIFVKMSYEISKRYVLLVTPHKWAGFTTNLRKGKISLYKEYMKGKLLSANIGECSKYFTVGNSVDSFSYYCIDKSGVNSTKLTTSSGVLNIDTTKIEFMPINISSKLTFDIINKYFNNDLPKYKFLSKYYINNCNTNKLTINSGQRQFIDKIKIFLDDPFTTEKPTKKCYQSQTPFPKGSTTDSINSILRSKLYTFIHSTYWNRDTFQVGYWDKVPFLDPTRIWNDVEVYNYFNLTQEEIDLIESTIK